MEKKVGRERGVWVISTKEETLGWRMDFVKIVNFTVEKLVKRGIDQAAADAIVLSAQTHRMSDHIAIMVTDSYLDGRFEYSYGLRPNYYR
jgi:exonuclease III